MASSQSEKLDRRSLHTLISSHDFEQAALENLSEKAWAFFSSAATDCVTKKANEEYFNRIWLRPQILKDVRDIRYNTKILGNSISLPLFVSPTAMVKLSHPDGELAIAKGCSEFGIAQTVRFGKGTSTTGYLLKLLSHRYRPMLRFHSPRSRRQPIYRSSFNYM